MVAHRQEAGRGRRGRSWSSLPGNLTASVLWPVPGIAPESLAQLGFVAGVALAGAIGATCGTLPGWDGDDPARSVRLKWPNDVLLSGPSSRGFSWRRRRCLGGGGRW